MGNVAARRAMTTTAATTDADAVAARIAAGDAHRAGAVEAELAALLARIADAGGNVVHADHIREAVPLHLGETGVELALETRGPADSDAILAALEAAGYSVRRLEHAERIPTTNQEN